MLSVIAIFEFWDFVWSMLPWVGKEVAGDPQNFDAGLLLELEGQVCDFIQVLVGLLQSLPLWGHVPERTETMKQPLQTPGSHTTTAPGKFRPVIEVSGSCTRVVTVYPKFDSLRDLCLTRLSHWDEIISFTRETQSKMAMRRARKQNINNAWQKNNVQDYMTIRNYRTIAHCKTYPSKWVLPVIPVLIYSLILTNTDLQVRSIKVEVQWYYHVLKV